MKKALLLFVFLLSSTLHYSQTSGMPVALINCGDVPSTCFNLTTNTPVVLGTYNPSIYTVVYYQSTADAASGFNPIATPTNFCAPTNPFMVYARVTISATNTGVGSTKGFSVSSTTYQNNTINLDLSQCDNNNDGLFVFDLTAIGQINTSNPLSYHTTLADAQNITNPIANPTAYTLTMQTGTTIYIREVVPAACDQIYNVGLQTSASCTIALPSCSAANSLCGSLGIPFSNTTGVPQNGPMGCLNSTPNGTWFYVPIANNGTIALTMSQTSTIGNAIDVDYIMFGPYTDPTTTCGNFNQLYGNIVGCSYSTAAVENVSFIAQQGQFYLLLITNFSNQAGQITITQGNIGQAGSGSVGCSGLRLNAFLDANANGNKDNGEPDFPIGEFHYEKNNNGVVHNITAPSGYYEIYDMYPANTYDVSYSIPGSYSTMYAIVPASYNNLSVPSTPGFTIHNFAVTALQNYNDLEVAVIPLLAPRPGFTYKNKIVYTNHGNQNVASGTLTFINDANVIITANTESGITPTATGFTFNFTNLAPFESRSMTVTMLVPTIPTVSAGQLLTNATTIQPLIGDVTPLNNSSSVSQTIVNAYDPNDKMEAHGDRILHSMFTSNDYLYYTIRFENTGTASAWDVKVTDFIDNQLDVTSVRMVNASHQYYMDRVGNMLTWTFNSIQLPISIPNTTIGKGYVTFKIKPLPGYAVGDIITNAASIYFDFNPAIVTNLFSTEFVAALGTTQFENHDFVFYPNPTSDVVTVTTTNSDNTITSIVVYDVLGKIILTEKTNNVHEQTIDLSKINSGMYFIEITTNSNLKMVKKLMVN